MRRQVPPRRHTADGDEVVGQVFTAHRSWRPRSGRLGGPRADVVAEVRLLVVPRLDVEPATAPRVTVSPCHVDAPATSAAPHCSSCSPFRRIVPHRPTSHARGSGLGVASRRVARRSQQRAGASGRERRSRRLESRGRQRENRGTSRDAGDRQCRQRREGDRRPCQAPTDSCISTCTPSTPCSTEPRD